MRFPKAPLPWHVNPQQPHVVLDADNHPVFAATYEIIAQVLTALVNERWYQEGETLDDYGKMHKDGLQNNDTPEAPRTPDDSGVL